MAPKARRNRKAYRVGGYSDTDEQDRVRAAKADHSYLRAKRKKQRKAAAKLEARMERQRALYDPRRARRGRR